MGCVCKKPATITKYHCQHCLAKSAHQNKLSSNHRPHLMETIQTSDDLPSTVVLYKYRILWSVFFPHLQRLMYLIYYNVNLIYWCFSEQIGTQVLYKSRWTVSNILIGYLTFVENNIIQEKPGKRPDECLALKRPCLDDHQEMGLVFRSIWNA